MAWARGMAAAGMAEAGVLADELERLRARVEAQAAALRQARDVLEWVDPEDELVGAALRYLDAALASAEGGE